MSQWLRRRGKIWHYKFAHGGIVYTGTTGATDLQTARVVLEEARRQAILLCVGRAPAPTLKEVVCQWEATRGRAVSPAHRRAAKQAREALSDLLALPLDRITTGRVQAWQGAHAEGHSSASTNLVLRYLKLWTRWAMRERLIREVPWEVAPLRVQERKRPVADLGLLDAVQAGIRNHQIRAALAMAMTLGLREAEVLHARWEWLRDGVYTVQGRTKSKRIRTIPVPEVLRVALLQMLAARDRGPTQQVPDLGLIFPGKDGKPHRQGWLRQALRRAGGPGMHRLRATFATLHLRSGTPLKEVQEMLGHADARTTLLYQETSMADKRKRQDELWA